MRADPKVDHSILPAITARACLYARPAWHIKVECIYWCKAAFYVTIDWMKHGSQLCCWLIGINWMIVKMVRCQLHQSKYQELIKLYGTLLLWKYSTTILFAPIFSAAPKLKLPSLSKAIISISDKYKLFSFKHSNNLAIQKCQKWVTKRFFCFNNCGSQNQRLVQHNDHLELSCNLLTIC